MPFSSLYDAPVERSLGLIARKYEIKPSMAARLKALRNYEIVIVCDDSGSMSTGIEGPERTRWDRLRNIVQLVLEIGVIFDSNGVDIYFLNQDPILNVKDPAQVIDIFSNGPSGYTPLAATLQEVFQLSPSRRGHDKQLLVFIATDGAPTDENGNEEIAPLEHIMREVRRAETTFVSFLICTDDREKVGYLNLWDQTMVNVDVTDDFINERERVRRYRGDSYPFSMGDYVVKALIGAIDPQINAINEPSPNQP